MQYHNNIEALSILAGLMESIKGVVGSTLGPNGSEVKILQTSRTQQTNDGLTILSNIHISPEKTHYELKSGIFKEILSGIRDHEDEVGDGTTSALVIIAELYKEFNTMIRVEGKGVTNKDIVTGLKDVRKFIREIVERHSRDIDLNKDIYNIAMVASHNDDKLSSMIADAYSQSKWPYIELSRQDNGTQTILKRMSGYPIKCTVYTQYLNLRVKKSYIPIIHFGEDIGTLYDKVKDVAKEIIIFSSANADILMRQISERTSITIVKMPFEGDTKMNAMIDLSSYIGLKIIQDEDIGKLTLGTAIEITLEKDRLLLDEGSCNIDSRNERVNYLQDSLVDMKYRRTIADAIRKALSALNNQYYVLTIGAFSSEEHTSGILTAQDTIKAVNSALSSGVVVGGGALYLEISRNLRDKYKGTHSGAITSRALLGYLEILHRSSAYNKLNMSGNTGLYNISYPNVIAKNVITKNDVVLNMEDEKIIEPTLVPLGVLTTAITHMITYFNAGIILINKGVVNG